MGLGEPFIVNLSITHTHLEICFMPNILLVGREGDLLFNLYYKG